MKILLSYSGIITKIRAMEKNFLHKDDYEKIANVETISGFVAFLKNHPGYQQLFHDLDENVIHRGQAEGIFIYGLYRDFVKIYRFANIEQRKALDLRFFRYEVNVLKSCIQKLNNEDIDVNLSLFTPFFAKHSNLNVSAIASSRTMEEYINNLKGTEYYPIFSKVQNSNNTTFFDYEMCLDIYYFMKIWKLKDKLLSGDNLKAVTNTLGTEIDLLNIMWQYRFKNYYDVPASNAYSILIPINYKLKKDQLNKLIETVSVDDFINVLKHTHYADFSSALQDNTMEFKFEQMLLKIYEDNIIKFPESMAPIYYYLHRKETEIKQLTTTIECIRYKLEPQDTLKYVLL